MYRVSEVLEFYKDYSNIPENILEEKRIIGTNVHSCINGYYNDIPLMPEGREVGYYNSFLSWQENHRMIPTHTEERYYGKGWYENLTGQIDAVLPLKSNIGSVLVDFKTSSKPDSLTWSLQAFYYHRLLMDNQIATDPFVLFLQLDPKGGNPKEHWIETSDPRLTEIAMATWTVFKAKKGLLKVRTLS